MFESKKHGPGRVGIIRVEKWVKQHEIITERCFIRLRSTEAIWEWAEEQGGGKDGEVVLQRLGGTSKVLYNRCFKKGYKGLHGHL